MKESSTAVVLFALLGLLLCLMVVDYRGSQGRKIKWNPRQDDLLDRSLIQLTINDSLTVRELVNGGVSIFGGPGSGKTSGSGKALATAIVQDRKNGGLILGAKPEDPDMWRQMFTAAGRSNDLKVFSPSENLRFNFLDYEMRHGGHTRNITQCLLTIGESLGGANGRCGADQEIFWKQQQERMIFNAVEIVKRGTGKVSGPELHQFILGAATSPEQLRSEEWRKSFHCECMEAGYKVKKSAIEASDFRLAADYWLGEFPSLADKTRSSILASVMGLLHVFNTGLVRELVSGETNITPDIMFAGTWVLVDMSPTQWAQLGSFVNAGWKFLTQRRVLRRKTSSTDYFNVIWADEAHQFVNSFDAHYIAQSRSHLGCMVFLSQSLPGYYSALQGDAGKNQALALLSCFKHTIFHAVDPETAEWASRKLGKRRQTFFGSSKAPQTDCYDALFGDHGITGTISEQYESVLQERVFMNGLRTGGPINGYACDAIIVKSGEPFSSRDNWLFKTFYQR